MASWRPDHSMILSLLLDTVVGTKEMTEIRQDYCKILDGILVVTKCQQGNIYFTGSKSEGLELPGSDEDYMLDINNSIQIKVTQSFVENETSSNFLMSTEHVPSCFVLLQHIPQAQTLPYLYRGFRYRNGIPYLSSDFIGQESLLCWSKTPVEKVKRQGPSAETWYELNDKSKSGTDNVSCIHCPFWPNTALEWVQRPRLFGWPTSQDVQTITDFGFHLVPVGHPLSGTKLIEWRLSFSIAERTLVWSLNHVQMQCYAVMKIILKEFIKIRCSLENQVLCSYFIKTFLFWQYETTELNFWRKDNIRECIKYLLTEFSKCIQEGLLRHYFIPSFNLLSVKFTRKAQIELLQLFDIAVQNDINILKECNTLQDVWLEFLQVRENTRYDNVIRKMRRQNLLWNDRCMIYKMSHLNKYVVKLSTFSSKGFSEDLAPFCKTPLKALMLKRCLFQMRVRPTLQARLGVSGNKGVYQICKTVQNDKWSIDISTCKLMCAILLYTRRDFSSALNIIHQMLSSIPPFARYYSYKDLTGSEVQQRYVDMFLDSDMSTIQRARKAWMFDLVFTINDLVPLAIQIELYCSNGAMLRLSPFTCAYYLQFMCYHRMQQYRNRDRALQQLIDITNNQYQCGVPYITLNIAGHCLLLAGKRVLARDMFNLSCMITKRSPPQLTCNPAQWYLLNCF